MKTPFRYLQFFLCTLPLAILAVLTPPKAEADRLHEILTTLELETDATPDQVLTALHRHVRRVLQNAPVSLAHFNHRIKILAGLGFAQKTLNQITFAQECPTWMHHWVWDNFVDLNNTIAQNFLGVLHATFTQIHQATQGKPLLEDLSYWQSIRNLLWESRRFLQGETERILAAIDQSALAPEASANGRTYPLFDGQRGGLSQAVIIDKELAGHYPDLKDNEQLLKLYTDVVIILWADVSMFAHLDHNPQAASYGQLPQLLDWRTSSLTLTEEVNQPSDNTPSPASSRDEHNQIGNQKSPPAPAKKTLNALRHALGDSIDRPLPLEPKASTSQKLSQLHGTVTQLSKELSRQREISDLQQDILTKQHEQLTRLTKDVKGIKGLLTELVHKNDPIRGAQASQRQNHHLDGTEQGPTGQVWATDEDASLPFMLFPGDSVMQIDGRDTVIRAPAPHPLAIPLADLIRSHQRFRKMRSVTVHPSHVSSHQIINAESTAANPNRSDKKHRVIYYSLPRGISPQVPGGPPGQPYTQPPVRADQSHQIKQ